MFCENCGNKLIEGSKFCGKCGARTKPLQASFSEAEAGSAQAAPTAQQSYSPPTRQAPPAQQSYRPPVQQTPAAQQPYKPQQDAGSYMESQLNAPLRVGQYIGMFLLLAIPIANLVLLLVWAFSGSVNQNKKNFARASLILSLIALVLWIIIGGFIISTLSQLLTSIPIY